MDNRPIGVFDSSVGGISVLRELVKVMPGEHYLYLGDTLNAPYGTRPESEIQGLSRSAAHQLVDRGVKAILIACNTATSAAAEMLRQELPIPVIGMEPALKPAALGRTSGRIAVLATPATLRQRKFHRLFEQYGEYADAIPCAGLMEFVERRELDTDAVRAYLGEKLAPKGPEPYTAIVMGCTHYVFLRRAIRGIAPDATLYDGNRGTALWMRQSLERRGLLGGGEGSVTFTTTGDEARILPTMQWLYTTEIEEDTHDG